ADRRGAILLTSNCENSRPTPPLTAFAPIELARRAMHGLRKPSTARVAAGAVVVLVAVIIGLTTAAAEGGGAPGTERQGRLGVGSPSQTVQGLAPAAATIQRVPASLNRVSQLALKLRLSDGIYPFAVPKPSTSAPAGSSRAQGDGITLYEPA